MAKKTNSSDSTSEASSAGTDAQKSAAPPKKSGARKIAIEPASAEQKPPAGVKKERRAAPRVKTTRATKEPAKSDDNAAKKSSEKKPRAAKTPKDLIVDTIAQAKSAVESVAPAPVTPLVEALSNIATNVVTTVAEAMPPLDTTLATPTSARDAVEQVQEAVTATPETFSLLSNDDVYLFAEGTHSQLYERMGTHPVTVAGVAGTYFAVWAPNAKAVSVIGDFNEWNNDAHPLRRRFDSGIWEGFFGDVNPGTAYKYHIVSQYNGYSVDKADPFGFHSEVAPRTASVVTALDYQWNDSEWMASRAKRNGLDAPMSIYEVHLGSWRRVPEEGDRHMTYREIAPELAKYVKESGFTHVEFLPLMEHPFYGSWGYQCTGFFAPTSRYGTPQDLMYLIDYLHQQEIGVILDWVPSHFPTDEHGLSYFDGTHLFEHADPRQGFHPDWNSLIFNYGRNEVRSFLLSSGAYWLDKYHADGLRVDAVASMLYLDYSRKAGEWIPNKYGGRENIEAVSFLRRLNEDMYTRFPGIQMIAEESTAWPMVSRPNYVGGLGFGLKWDMGWMHDTLRYMQNDPIHRRYHHNSLTFRMMYAYTENFLLPLSHDEVVHGKGSLINKMPGDEWQKFANLRLLFAYMFAQPAKKLLFMGGEFGQGREWNHDRSLDWHLLGEYFHSGLRDWLRDLNGAYQNIRSMHELDVKPAGFEWIDANDSDQSIISFMRRSTAGDDTVVVVLNFTPIVRHNYQIGVPEPGYWKEILNSDARHYGGSGQGNLGGVEAAPVMRHGRAFSLNLTLPPLGAVFLQRASAATDVRPIVKPEPIPADGVPEEEALGPNA